MREREKERERERERGGVWYLGEEVLWFYEVFLVYWPIYIRRSLEIKLGEAKSKRERESTRI